MTQLRPFTLCLLATLALGIAAGCSTPEPKVLAMCPPSMLDTGHGCVVIGRVAVNSVGYLPDRVKRATVAAPVDAFQVRDLDGNVVYEGVPSGPVSDAVSSTETQDLWVLDFTELTAPGDYFVTVDGPEPYPESAPFAIGDGVYDPLLHALMLGMTGLRCGSEVAFDWEGTSYAHDACHLEDASLAYVGGTHRDGTGGWHDAGDYGKYTVNGAFTSGMMLLAWEHFPEHLAGRPFDLPETGDDVPDYLDENRVNLEWLLKMQNEDGSVAHKLTSVTYADLYAMPEDDLAERFFSDWGSAGTGDFVAVMAQAARVYAEIDADFADRCLQAAQQSYAFLGEHPDTKEPVRNQSQFREMQYSSDPTRPGSDSDERAWAACELWATTGDATALADCEARLDLLAPGTNWDWSNVGSLAVYTYVLSAPPDPDLRNPELLQRKADEIVRVADSMAAAADRNPWGLAYTGGRYWGINGVYARTVIGLRTAYLLDPKPEYLDAATQQIDHLLGRNYYARSQVTGIGSNPPAHPHHRPSMGDTVSAPWPGLLIGGAQPNATSWKDDSNDAQTSEIAINWNAALIYAVASFVH